MGRVTPQLSHPPRGGSRAAPAPPGDCAAGERAPHLPIAHGGNDAENGTARQHRCPGRAGPGRTVPTAPEAAAPGPCPGGWGEKAAGRHLNCGHRSARVGAAMSAEGGGAAAPPGKGCPPAAAVRVPCGWAGRDRSGTATGGRPGCCARRPRVAAGTGRCSWAPSPGSRSPQGRVRLSECGGPGRAARWGAGPHQARPRLRRRRAGRQASIRG